MQFLRCLSIGLSLLLIGCGGEYERLREERRETVRVINEYRLANSPEMLALRTKALRTFVEMQSEAALVLDANQVSLPLRANKLERFENGTYRISIDIEEPISQAVIKPNAASVEIAIVAPSPDRIAVSRYTADVALEASELVIYSNIDGIQRNIKSLRPSALSILRFENGAWIKADISDPGIHIIGFRSAGEDYVLLVEISFER